MTKTLTEQWRDNDLADDKLYYWRISDGQELVQNKLGMCAYRLCNDSDKIECLAPVPSYEQFIGLMDDSKELDKAYDKINLLEKKLEIATKALKEINKNYRFTVAQDVVYKALKEMEGVK